MTIASAFFALSDLIYTKIEIDKREADEVFNLYFLYKYASKIYMQEIEDKYAEQTEEYLSNLEKILGEEKLEKVFQSKLTKNEKTMCLNKVNDIKLKQFLNAWIIRAPCPCCPDSGNRKSVFEETTIPVVETFILYP